MSGNSLPPGKSGPPPFVLGVLGVVLAIVLLGVLLGVWYQEAARPENRVLLATPSAAFASLFDQLGQPALWRAILATLRDWIIGFGIGGLAGIGIGVAAGRWRAIGAVAGPTLFLVGAMPVALLPLLFILWEGLDRHSGTALAAGLVAFTAAAAIAGHSQRGDGVDRWQGVLRALEVGAVLGLAAVMFVEAYAGTNRLGTLAMTAFSTFDTARMFAMLVLVWLMGLVVALPFALARWLVGFAR